MAKEEQMFLIVIVFAKLFLKPCTKDIVSLHSERGAVQCRHKQLWTLS